MSFLDLFKRKTTIPVKKIEDKDIRFLYECVSKFSEQTGAEPECVDFLKHLSTLPQSTPLTEDLKNQFKYIIGLFLKRELNMGEFYFDVKEFQTACCKFNSYATARKEPDGSYSICPVITHDKLIEYIANHYLNNSNSEITIIEALKETNKQSYADMLHSKINTYYGNLEYIQTRTKAILDAIQMISSLYALAPDEYQFLEIKKVEATECAKVINSVSNDTMTQDIYFDVVHKSFHELVTIEKELSFISERIWKQYFENRGAKFVHALSGRIVSSDQMPKICTSLYLGDLATIPYGHTGYEYDVQMDNIACICEEDVGSWHITKKDFLGENRGGIMHSWQYDESTNMFYEFGYHSILLPPDYIEQKARKNNTGQHMSYTEILLMNTVKKISPVKAFYTEKATPEEIQQITSLAQQQGITVEFINTQMITEKMKARIAS